MVQLIQYWAQQITYMRENKYFSMATYDNTFRNAQSKLSDWQCYFKSKSPNGSYCNKPKHPLPLVNIATHPLEHMIRSIDERSCCPGLPDILWEKKPNHVQKKAKRSKKSQIVKNHEISVFSMCYHVFSNMVNKANNTVTEYAHSNLKFSHFQCITFAAWSLNNFEGSLSCWWNSPPMFLACFMIHQVSDRCSVPW